MNQEPKKQSQDLAATPREKILEEGPPKITPEEGKISKAEEGLERKIGAGFQTSLKILPFSFQESQKLNRTTKEIIISHLLELPKEEITQENYEKLLRKVWPRIQEELEKKGLSFSQTQVENFIKEFIKTTQLEAIILTTTARRPFSREIATRLEAEEEGVAFWPAYPLSQPKLIWAYLKRAIFSLPKKALEIAASEVSPEEQEIWSQMIEKGLFAEDVEASIEALKRAGLPEAHPTILKLKDKQAQILAVQKTEGRDKPAVRILKSYYELPRLAGRQQIYEPETRMYLPRLSPPPLRGRLEQFLNQIGLATRLYQKIKLAPGKTVIRPYLSERLMRLITRYRFSSFSHLSETIYRKTFGQIIKALAKTGLGQTIKAGVKRGAVWLATKLGIKTIAAAIGVAAGPPAWVISAILLVAEKIIKFVWNKILKPIVSAITRTIKEPKKALGWVAVGALTVVLLPMPFALIGFVPVILGGLGLASWGLAGAGGAFAGLASGVIGFFTSLTIAPAAAAPIGLFVASTTLLIGALTFFTVMVTAAAFVLPLDPTKIAAGKLDLIPPRPRIFIGQPAEPRNLPITDYPAEAAYLAEQVIFILKECGLSIINQETWFGPEGENRVQECLEKAEEVGKLDPGQARAIADQFWHSVFEVEGGVLQCVGFVRGIMAAVGKDPGGDRDANDYWDNPPPGYYPVGVDEIQPGDLGIMRGEKYGHIVIVISVDKENNTIKTAQAWGGEENGRLEIRELNPAYFTGFLRPK